MFGKWKRYQATNGKWLWPERTQIAAIIAGIIAFVAIPIVLGVPEGEWMAFPFGIVFGVLLLIWLGWRK